MALVNPETDRINDAIARSISHNEIVTMDWTADRELALLAACQDHVDTRDHRGVQFWGSDESDEWRVHLRRADVPA